MMIQEHPPPKLLHILNCLLSIYITVYGKEANVVTGFQKVFLKDSIYRVGDEKTI